jgi:hypothetical protein
VNVRQLPASVRGVQRNGAVLEPVSVSIKAATGDLLPTAIPKVSIVKDAQQFGGDAAVDDGSRSAATEVDILARIAHNLEHAPLAGFVGEGMAPYSTNASNRRGGARIHAAAAVSWRTLERSAVRMAVVVMRPALVSW